MKLVSVNELSQLTGSTRATVNKKISDLVAVDGPKQAKLYDSVVALRAIMVGPASKDGLISYADAQRDLAVSKRAEIELGMEVTRKERIPLDVLETVNDKVLSNVAGIIKANEGKLLTEQLIRDILGEMREIGAALTTNG